MRKLAFLLALTVLLSACSKPRESVSTSQKVVAGTSASVSSEAEEPASEESEQTPSEAAEEEAAKAAEEAARAASEAAAQEAARAASEAAALEAERAASEAAAQEAARAASEAAALEAERAASEAAALEAERAASEAAALEAERAASEAAAAEAKQAKQKAAAKKVNVSGANFLSDVETEVLQLQNDERARLGLQPLQYDASLQAAARIRSRELCKAGMFAHTRTDGREWYTVIQEDVPFEYKSAGENLGTAEYNDPNVHLATDADFWVDSWIDSPPHYTNMVRAEYNRAGVGIYRIVRDGMTYAYATTIFACVEE